MTSTFQCCHNITNENARCYLVVLAELTQYLIICGQHMYFTITSEREGGRERGEGGRERDGGGREGDRGGGRAAGGRGREGDRGT